MKTAVKKNTTDPIFNEVLKVAPPARRFNLVWRRAEGVDENWSGFAAVSSRAPPAVWEEAAGDRVAFRNPEEEGVPGAGPHPPGRLEVRGGDPRAFQLVPTLSKGE